MRASGRQVPWSCVPGFLVAAVLLVAGLLKTLFPAPAASRALHESFDGLLSEAAGSIALRALGVLEVALGVSILRRRTRRAALCLAIAALAAFALLLAARADDAAWLEDCGCFGSIGLPAGPLELSLARNSLLVAAATFGLLSARSSLRRSSAAALALTLASALFASSRAAAGFVLERSARALQAARADGERRRATAGWVLPDVALRDERGVPCSAGTHIRARDTLLFFSPSCPHCARQARAWPGFAAAVQAGGGRLLLVAVDRASDAETFKHQRGCAGLPHVSLVEPRDFAALGFSAVPQVLALDEQRRVRFHGESPVVHAAVVGDSKAGSERRRFCASGAGPMQLELEVSLGTEETIARIEPRAAGGHLLALDPSLGFVQELVGCSREEGVRIAALLARQPAPEAELWRAAAGALAGLPPAAQEPSPMLSR